MAAVVLTLTTDRHTVKALQFRTVAQLCAVD